MLGVFKLAFLRSIPIILLMNIVRQKLGRVAGTPIVCGEIFSDNGKTLFYVGHINSTLEM